MEIVEWVWLFLNQNSSAIQAILTAALVVVTGLYVVLVKGTLREMQRHNRPYVFVEVVKRGALLDSVVRNTGHRGADDVRLKIHRDVVLADPRGILGWPLFQKPIPFLPPGRSVSQEVAHLPSARKPEHPAGLVLDYTVTYRDRNETYEQRFAYDLSFLFPVGGDAFPLAGNDVAVALNGIRDGVRSLVQLLDDISQGLRRRKAD